MMKNVIFDMGRVLVRFEPDEICACCVHDEQKGKVLADVILRSSEWICLDEGTLSFSEAESLFLERRPELKNEIRQVLNHYDEYVTPIEPMFDLISKLKNRGYRLYILSNIAERYWNLKKRIPALSLFDGEIISCEEKVNKPDPRIYEILLKRFELNPSECLFIDDREENLTVPKEMGFTVHCFHDPETLECFLMEAGLIEKESRKSGLSTNKL